MKHIIDVAKSAHIDEKYVICYGKDKCKIDLSINEELKGKKDGKLVLVTAITPTKAGEGKTTTSIALHDGLRRIGVDSLLCLREPSLGPVFGLKGGATGGGLASICPSDDINLHFTGDMHALTSSINLIAAIIDNSLYQGNPLNINPERIVWKRALDMNDRALRKIVVGLSDKKEKSHDEEFVITVASELMAILCLSTAKEDFKNRVNDIIVAYTFDEKPVRVKDLQISNAIMKLMRDAFHPNMVQTLEGNPVFVHGGPFANIAHGCNSLFATKLALKLSDVVITEAGFGADLGMEKFFDIACQVGQLKPNLVVLVATIRALKLHGGVKFDDLSIENVDALKSGVENLKRHVENVKKFGLDFVININHFTSDTEKETKWLESWCEQNGYKYAFCDAFTNGSKGSEQLAKIVSKTLNNTNNLYHPLYQFDEPIKAKIEKICKEIYRAKEVIYSEKALEDIAKCESLGYDKTPICIAKTPLSFSDDPKLLNAPIDFDITIREVRLSAGAKFIVPLTGAIMTMPGLPKVPAAVKMENE